MAAFPLVLHLIVHNRPSEPIPRRPSTLFGRAVHICHPTPAQLSQPLSVSFDEALDRLAELPRLYIEMDGSFVWVGPSPHPAWQIDGQLNDAAVGLMTVELKVAGTQGDLLAILKCLGWPQQALVYQLVQQGIYLEHDDFLGLCHASRKISVAAFIPAAPITPPPG